MFDKAKKVNELRKAQSEMQKIMEQIQSHKTKMGLSVVVNANNKIVSIERDGEEDKILKDLLNDALKDARKRSEKKLRGQMSSLGLGDLL